MRSPTHFQQRHNMEEDAESALGSMSDLTPSVKKPRLESGVAAMSGESRPWSYVGGNKPVGIAQPFQMKESVDTELADDPTELKPQQLTDLKADFKSSDVKVGSRTGDVLKKPSLKDHCGGVDSDSDTNSTFEYHFEPPSSSDDGLSGDERLQPTARDKTGGGGARDKVGGGGE